MRRLVGWCGIGCLVLAILAGCGNADQQLRSEGARAARDAASAAGTARLAGQSFLDHKLWPQPATRLVGAAEESLGKVAGTFSLQQPETPASRQLYDQITKALDDAESTVTDLRIALTNSDLDGVAKLVRELSGALEELRRLGESAK